MLKVRSSALHPMTNFFILGHIKLQTLERIVTMSVLLCPLVFPRSTCREASESRSKFPSTDACRFISHRRNPWRLAPQGSSLNLATTKFIWNFCSIHLQPLGYGPILPASACCNDNSSPPWAPCSARTERLRLPWRVQPARVSRGCCMPVGSVQLVGLSREDGTLAQGWIAARARKSKRDFCVFWVWRKGFAVLIEIFM